MITEDYCSYEIAKLLKEKGFKNIVKSLWIGEDKQHYISTESIIPDDYNSGGTCLYSAPTHQMALKWLREVHSIYITSEPNINDKHCFYPEIYTMTEESWDRQCFAELEELSFAKPEQAIEVALKYTLENLI